MAFAIMLAGGAAAADTVRIPRSIIEAAWKTADCSIDIAEVEAEQEAQPLTGRLRLVELHCWRAAYQAGSIFLVLDPAAPAKARLVRFPIWQSARRRLGFTYTLTSPEYDPATRTLSMAHKGRGLGDCGEVGRWLWTGTEFRLIGFWSKPGCDGEPFDGESSRWQVYPPAAKRRR